MQLDFLFRLGRPCPPNEDALIVGARKVPLRFVRNHFARRYILRLKPDGSARVTIPRGGSQREARNFAERHATWIERQLLKPPPATFQPKAWLPGTEILFRGERVTLATSNSCTAIQFADQVVSVASPNGNWRPFVERHLWKLAAQELAPRTWELAALHGLAIRRVTVRNQRSRWGSCSAKGTISLNWRLIQTPVFVRDYIILHELMHLREMNHSHRYWRGVEQVCPHYRDAEQWLKKHAGLLRQ